jgi:hypothetical protein
MKTSRSDFNETWLAEMPAKLGNFGDTFSIVNTSITEWVAAGKVPEQLSPALFRLSGQNISYYWYQTLDEITLAVELEKRPQGLAVSIIGKNPKCMNQSPYATELYSDILKHNPYSLLLSDNQISDSGIKLWKRLLTDPANIVSVYNHRNPARTFKTITSVAEMDAVLGPDHYYDRFVLSHKGTSLAETRSYFNTRRYRELAGISLED